MAQIKCLFKYWLVTIDEHLQVFLFGFMCLGLIAASIFLMMGLLDGNNWTTVCGILFGSHAVGGGVASMGKNMSKRPTVINGNKEL